MATPWADGLWYNEDSPSNIVEVKGGEGKYRNLVELDYPDYEPEPGPQSNNGTLTFGTFHETIKEIEELTGAKHYNVKLEFFMGFLVQYGVLDDDGKTIRLCNHLNQIDTLRWMSLEKQQELLESRVHEDAIIPPGFTPQPDNQGKILFLSGPPGAGKSTTAQLMAKEKGWVYYEADCFGRCVNPFIPLDVDEPSMAQIKQLPIKGRTQEIYESLKSNGPEFQKILQRKPYDAAKIKTYCRMLAKDIVRHKQRLGGTFAIAMAVPTQEMRDNMKEVFGPQGIFVCLRLSKETNFKRVEARHSEGDSESNKKFVGLLTGIYDLYEDTQPGEENCITVHVDPDDTPDGVMKKILKQVDEL